MGVCLAVPAAGGRFSFHVYLSGHRERASWPPELYVQKEALASAIGLCPQGPWESWLSGHSQVRTFLLSNRLERRGPLLSGWNQKFLLWLFFFFPQQFCKKQTSQRLLKIDLCLQSDHNPLCGRGLRNHSKAAFPLELVKYF